MHSLLHVQPVDDVDNKSDKSMAEAIERGAPSPSQAQAVQSQEYMCSSDQHVKPAEVHAASQSTAPYALASQTQPAGGAGDGGGGGGGGGDGANWSRYSSRLPEPTSALGDDGSVRLYPVRLYDGAASWSS